MKKLDLNDEEFEECFKEYVEVFTKSKRGPADRVTLMIRLSHIGLTDDEIDAVLREVL